MPSDRRGQHLRPGDIVYVPCVVTGIDRHLEGLNIALDTVEPISQGSRIKAQLLLNSKQTELYRALGESNPDMDVTAAIHEKIVSQSGGQHVLDG